MIGAVAHYNLLERIADEGGLGEVYRARDTRVGRTVALKLLPAAPAGDHRHERLVDDAQAATVLSHPNIATLFDAGHHEGRLYLAYEFIQGTTLRQQMTGTPMNTAHALELAVQVADALAEAHRRGVVHKDLRPDTILETPKGSAKVMDFGLYRWTRGGQTRALAAASPDSVDADSVGIVSYMSPEQALGGRVDARTDIFSLAVVVYEMVTGVNPFAGADVAATLINITRKVPAAPSSLQPDLPKLLDVVLGRALARDLAQRTDGAAKLGADLQRCLGLVERRAGNPPPPHAAAPAPGRRTDLLPIEEDRGSHGLWWVVAVLGGGIAAAVYYFVRS